MKSSYTHIWSYYEPNQNKNTNKSIPWYIKNYCMTIKSRWEIKKYLLIEWENYYYLKQNPTGNVTSIKFH